MEGKKSKKIARFRKQNKKEKIKNNKKEWMKCYKFHIYKLNIKSFESRFKLIVLLIVNLDDLH